MLMVRWMHKQTENLSPIMPRPNYINIGKVIPMSLASANLRQDRNQVVQF